VITTITRRLLAEIAWPWSTDEIAPVVEIDADAGVAERRAVYVALDRRGEVDYVGSTASEGVLAHRVRRHLRDAGRRRDWHRLVVLRLRDDTPEAVVRRLEGAVGRALAPARNRRLPRP
jgi:Uri superfamily endonuclease